MDSTGFSRASLCMVAQNPTHVPVTMPYAVPIPSFPCCVAHFSCLLLCFLWEDSPTLQLSLTHLAEHLPFPSQFNLPFGEICFQVSALHHLKGRPVGNSEQWGGMRSTETHVQHSGISLLQYCLLISSLEAAKIGIGIWIVKIGTSLRMGPKFS